MWGRCQRPRPRPRTGGFGLGVIQSLRRTLHPAWYQGPGKRSPYFEGWYFKLVDAEQRHRLAVIPGIHRGADPGESHAFIQVLEGVSGKAAYHRYPAEAFQAAQDPFAVWVGASRFTLDRMELEIDCPEGSVAGAVAFCGLVPWPVTLASPGAMGWFAWIPFLQTYHGVLSLDHGLHGSLVVDGVEIDFDGGRGYIEKDWGRSFPDAWIWLQTNHFDRPGTSLTASVATIPWLWTSFRGFIVGLWHRGRLYRFATYSGARMEDLTFGDERVRVCVSDGSYRLEFVAHGAEGGVLRGPTGYDMGGRVPESLQAWATVRLWSLKGGASTLAFDAVGRSAGLEVVGDRGRLLG